MYRSPVRRDLPTMRTLLFLCLSAVLASPALADLQLAKAKNCMTCHGVDKKVIGPAFKDVAAKYKGEAGAGDKLAGKIIKGGSGVWGPVSMPANPQVSEADAKKLAEWVLQQ